MSVSVMTFRRLVKPEDLNPANFLFGGRIMEWADEAGALYAMCQMRTKNAVTLKISEVLFKNPARQGDILEFYCKRTKVGRTSMTVELIVNRKDLLNPRPNRGVYDDDFTILKCEFTFVSVGEDGRPIPHQGAEETLLS